MEYQNLQFPESEYRAFGEALIQAEPRLDDELEDQDVINMYNEIKAKEPNATIEEIVKIIPQLVPQITAKMEQASQVQDQPGKMEALRSMGR